DPVEIGAFEGDVELEVAALGLAEVNPQPADRIGAMPASQHVRENQILALPVYRSSGTIRMQLPPMERATVDFEAHVFAAVRGARGNLTVDVHLRRRVKDEGFDRSYDLGTDGLGDRHGGQIAGGVGEIEALPEDVDADALRFSPFAIAQDERLIDRQEPVGIARPGLGQTDELFLIGHIGHRRRARGGELRPIAEVALRLTPHQWRDGEFYGLKNLPLVAQRESRAQRLRIDRAGQLHLELARATVDFRITLDRPLGSRDAEFGQLPNGIAEQTQSASLGEPNFAIGAGARAHA